MFFDGENIIPQGEIDYEDASMCKVEAFALYLIVKSLKSLKGELAELGVYKGGSAKIIHKADPNKSLSLFDTWAGLPPESPIISDSFTGDFDVEIKEVKKIYKAEKNVYFYEGVFPKTTERIKKKTFSFVHIDADLYISTLEGLKFFYPRMVKRGIIVIHDYS